MPNTVASAVAATVLPYSLCSLYTESYDWPVRVSGPYMDGSIITNVQATASRRSWTIQQRLLTEYNALYPSNTLYSTLEAFRLARKGTLECFYFYPVKADYDATGVSTTGRYLVRFAGQFQYTQGIARTTADFKLIQVQ